MNYQRRHPRSAGARGRSSDWSYIQLEKGKSKRAHVTIRRWLERAMASWKEYYGTR